MRIVHLTPGTGSFYCGSCLRDHDLVMALRARGHDVTMVPLYLPLVSDEPIDDDVAPVFLGGVNMYLQEKSKLFRKMPRFLTRFFDSGFFLKAAGKRAGMTDAKLLGSMTLSSFEGSSGNQAEEFKRLVNWIRDKSGADLVSLSNGLLAGIAVDLKREAKIPVICSLHGEDAFLDMLAYPYRDQCWEKFREASAAVDRFVAVSEYYGAEMRRRLGLDEEKFRVVWNGVDVERFKPPEKPPEQKAIGFLARLIKGKGLDMLLDAFLVLKATGQANDVRLRIAGSMTPSDEPYLESLKKRIADGGLEADVDILPNLSLEEKIEFLHSISLLSVPATYGESFGLYVIEALACGVPFVQPRHASFPELYRETDGGLLCEPDNAIELAGDWHELLSNPERRQELGRAGRANVEKKFSRSAMAGKFAAVCEELMEQRTLAAVETS